jgi:sulfite reductase beta subunit
MAELRPPIESGAPDPMPYMHPVMVKNYGKWSFHSHPKPGVLYHRAESGDEVWTVKAGTARQMDHYTIRELADIADQYGDGFVRFTARSNIEYMVADGSKVEPLIKALNDRATPSAAPPIRCP